MFDARQAPGHHSQLCLQADTKIRMDYHVRKSERERRSDGERAWPSIPRSIRVMFDVLCSPQSRSDCSGWCCFGLITVKPLTDRIHLAYICSFNTFNENGKVCSPPFIKDKLLSSERFLIRIPCQTLTFNLQLNWGENGVCERPILWSRGVRTEDCCYSCRGGQWQQSQ